MLFPPASSRDWLMRVCHHNLYFNPVHSTPRRDNRHEFAILISVSAGLESVLVSVWQQSLIDKKKTVDLDDESYAVRQTSKSKLKQIDFRFEDRELRGIEQNPNTKSRWAKLARKGKQVMQFLDNGRYIAVVVDGKTHIY
jgi:hypothetical protein